MEGNVAGGSGGVCVPLPFAYVLFKKLKQCIPFCLLSEGACIAIVIPHFLLSEGARGLNAALSTWLILTRLLSGICTTAHYQLRVRDKDPE